MKREGADNGPPCKHARVAQLAQVASGRIVSWFQQKGYGFIQSNACPKDVFFAKQELPAELQELHHERLKELEVSFELVELDGKPRAQMISLKGRPVAHQLAQSSRPPDPWQQPLHSGTVRSYDAKKGFGFIHCDQLNQDVFYLRAELPRELDHCEPQRSQLVERRVDFEVRQHENGKLRAHGLRFLPSMPPKAPLPPPGVEGPSDGRIRKYYPEKGYGFIESPGKPDLFFLAKSLCPELSDIKQLEGCDIGFQASVTEEGKMRACNIVPRQSQRMLAPPPLLAPPPPLLPPPPPGPVAVPPHALADRVLIGKVTTYDTHKGYGFIRVDHLQGDVYFQKQELPWELRDLQNSEVVGRIIEFELETKADGKFRARKLLHLETYRGAPRARGRVVKMNGEKGYGFLEAELGSGSKKNVFFLRKQLPKDLMHATLEELEALEISFEWSAKEQDKPRASSLEVLGREKVEVRTPADGEVLMGAIVDFNVQKGFGFIRPKALVEDIHFVRAELPVELSSERREEVVGQQVEVQVAVKPDNTLRAQRIRLLREGDAPSAASPQAAPQGLLGEVEQPDSDLDVDLVQEMEDYLVTNGFCEKLSVFANHFKGVAREKLEKHFQFSQGGDEDVVQLHHDHPRRRAEQAQETDEIDPDEPSIPPGEQLLGFGVIEEYDRQQGWGRIRCKGYDEVIRFPRDALPPTFRQNSDTMPELKGVQVGFAHPLMLVNAATPRHYRTDKVHLLLHYLGSEQCWLLKRQSPSKRTQ